MTTLSSSCERSVPFVILYCFDIPECKDMYDVRRGATGDRPCISCLVSLEVLCSMKCEVTRKTAATLSAQENYAMMMDMVNRMKVEIYEQLRRDEMSKAGKIVSQLLLQSVLSFGATG